MNFIAATARRDPAGIALNFADAGAAKFDRLPLSLENGQKITLGIRPEHVEVAAEGLPMVVTLTEHLGGNTVLYGTLGKDQPLVVQIVGQAHVKRGDRVHVVFSPANCHAFDEQGRRISDA